MVEKLAKEDPEARELFFILRKLFRDNFAPQIPFSCDEASLARCEGYLTNYLTSLRSAPEILKKILGKAGKKPKRTADSNSALIQQICAADREKLKQLLFPVGSSIADETIMLLCMQMIIAVHALANLKNAIQTNKAEEILPLAYDFNIAVINMRCGAHIGINCGILQKPKSEQGFRAYFIDYIRSLLQKRQFESSRVFWTFLRKEAGTTPISIGKYHIQVNETDLWHNEGAPPKDGCSSVKKSSVLRYFTEALK